MKKRFVTIVLLFALSVVLNACAENGPMLESSEVWETAPAIEFGLLSTDKLQTLPWNSGRCEATSFYRMAETETGYYLLYAGKLFFAEKTDLSTWFPACSKPDCKHVYASSECEAAIGGNSILIYEGRIFFSTELQNFPAQYLGSGSGKGIFSKTGDGSNTKLEHYVEESLIYSGGSCSSLLTPKQWILSYSTLEADGSIKGQVYIQTKSDLYELFSGTVEQIGSRTVFTYIPGDLTYCNSILDPVGSYALRLENDTVSKVDISNYWDSIRYISGNTLRIFYKDEGYYDVRIGEDKKTFVAVNRLNGSNSFIPLPNCILETNLGAFLSTGVFGSEMEIYNGNDWLPVSISDEVTALAPGTTLSVFSVSSDRIFLILSDSLNTYLCQILLDTESPRLTLCTELEVF